MTSPNVPGAPTPPFLRPMTASAPSAHLDPGRMASPGTGRALASSTFAGHLALLCKERGGRMPATPALACGGEGSATGSEEGAPDGMSARARPSGARSDAEERGTTVVSASEDVAVDRGAIDPMFQLLGVLAPRALPPNAPVPPGPAAPIDARTPIEQVMGKLVRRIAWSGNARVGVARLELGAGELEGATLTIQSDDGVVRVALDLPPGVDRAAWKERISGRLGARGLHVEAVDVT